MPGRLRIAVTTLIVLAGTPAYAYAADGGSIVPSWLPYAGGFVSLLVALALLLEVLRLRKLAYGAAISAHAFYVIAAVVCLVTSALVYWLANFVPSLSVGHALLAANLLVTAAMGLLVMYFAAVRLRFERFIRDLTESLDDDDITEGTTHA